jgi:hypothetical protein
MYGSWEGLVAGLKSNVSHLRKRLYEAEPLLERPLAIAGLPYGFVAGPRPGPWRLGDQAAVIPSSGAICPRHFKAGAACNLDLEIPLEGQRPMDQRLHCTAYARGYASYRGHDPHSQERPRSTRF